MFRSRFNDAFPKSLPNYGPQDIEHGVVETVPSEQVERLLCALLGLVLNRKKDIEYVPGGIHQLHLAYKASQICASNEVPQADGSQEGSLPACVGRSCSESHNPMASKMGRKKSNAWRR